MKKILLSILILLSATSAFAMSYEEASVQDKPIVLYLYMNRCSGCRQVAPVFNTMKEKYSSKFNFVKEDIYKSSIGEKLGVESVPTIYIMEPKKNVSQLIDRTCAGDAACFAKTLEKYCN